MQLSRAAAPLLTLAALGLSIAPAARAQGFAGPFDPSSFTASGTATDFHGYVTYSFTQAITPSTGPASTVDFTYSAGKSGGLGINGTFDYKTTATDTGTAPFSYDYSGNHAYYVASAFFNVVDYTTGTSVTLVPDTTTTKGDFQFTGTGAINVNKGDTFGFEIGGNNQDSTAVLTGDLKITDFNAAPAPEPSTCLPFAFMGLAATALILKAKRRHA